MTISIRKMFELLNKINHTPSQSNIKLDAKIKFKESINAVLTSPDGNKTTVRSK